jgi:hypothetical protein
MDHGEERVKIRRRPVQHCLRRAADHGDRAGCSRSARSSSILRDYPTDGVTGRDRDDLSCAGADRYPAACPAACRESPSAGGLIWSVRTSSSRSVSTASRSGLPVPGGGRRTYRSINRRTMTGASSVSPVATTRTASASCSGRTSLGALAWAAVENQYNGVPHETQLPIPPPLTAILRSRSPDIPQ